MVKLIIKTISKKVPNYNSKRLPLKFSESLYHQIINQKNEQLKTH